MYLCQQRRNEREREGEREREREREREYNVVKDCRAGNHEGTSDELKVLLLKYLHNHVIEHRLVMTMKQCTVIKQDNYDEQNFTWRQKNT